MDERLRPSERLRKRTDIVSVIRTPGTRGRFMTVHIRVHSGQYSRLAVVAARSTGKAVERNRAKRRIREIFRKNKRKLNRTADIVVRVKPSIRDASYAEIAAEFLGILNERRLLHDKEYGASLD